MSESPLCSSVPIAIVGAGYTLPGVSAPQAFAELLRGRRRSYDQLPLVRLPRSLYLDPSAPVGAPRVPTALGGAIASSPAGSGSDPGDGEVPRLVRDAVGRALADAKLAPDALRGMPVPVFVAHARGGGHGLYDLAVVSAAERLLPYLAHGAHPEELAPQALAALVDEVGRSLGAALAPGLASDGRGRGVHRLAGGIAEALGTTGKALVVDGNCTGGLVALELAQHELARGAPWAIAGAVSYVDVVNQVLYANARLLSKVGCLPFAERGDGTVISDGVVVLVLTQLARARDAGLPILGVIRGVAGANDGASQRYMLAPDPRGHASAIARAQDRAGIAPGEPGVFLAHGSGTRAGDTVEAEVFRQALARGGAPRPATPVPVLSIKGHVGHAKEAAGLANLVALLAMFADQRLPGPVHDEPIRTQLAGDGWIEVRHTAAAWPVGPRPRIGGVSAIASGGQNYHAVVEEAPAPARLAVLCAPRAAPRDEPIAIVGLAAELPGARDLRALWANLIAGAQSFRAGDWGNTLGAPLALAPARFADRAARYSERPADILRYDPLHFLLVDLARAAAAPLALPGGANASVVISADHCSEYGLRQVVAARVPEISDALCKALAATGMPAREVERTLRSAMRRFGEDLPELWPGSLFNLSPSFLAARIARALDLSGPTCAIEAGGAASSLAGLELACRRLADREVDAAIWGAADMRLGAARLADEAEYLSQRPAPTALDLRADGYLPGEGAAVIALRRLADARARGEPVYAVIHAIGSAFAPPAPARLTDPEALAQAIERAYARCAVTAEALAFVECAATGHPASDAAELAALRATIAGGGAGAGAGGGAGGGAGARARPLPIGTVVPNIGYTGAAAGAASLIKAVMALGAQTLPGTAAARSPLTGAQLGDRLVVSAQPIALAGARFAGVSATGLGGNHYHVVLERGSHAAGVIA